LPIAARNSTGIGPACSIVRYEMQRRASSRYGATIARVGQTSRQAVQRPQWSAWAGVRGSGMSTQISPRKNIEPPSRDSASVCLPRQPVPLRAASSTSSSGAESVNTRCPSGPTSAASRSASFCRRERNTL
jgi:hypothetical protein